MKCIILGKTTLEGRLYFHRIVHEMFKGVGVHKVSGTRYWLENGNSFEIITKDSNCRGKRADLVLYDDLYVFDEEVYNSILAPFVSWDAYLKKNNYEVELI